MRILMVSPYPPTRDGIAAYAVQTVSRLRAEGHDVEVLSPGPSAAHHHLDLLGPRGALALAKRVRGYERVIVQFHPDFFFPPGCEGLARAAINASLAVAFRLAPEIEVVVHEIDYRRGVGFTPAAVTARALWQAADRIVVHTESERADFRASFGVAPSRLEIGSHGADFVRRTAGTKADARRHLGLDPQAHLFVSIGFIQPHKGFDRAVRAFASLPAGASQLHIVGSVRVEEAEYLEHLDDLDRLVRATPGAHLDTEFVSDADFDRWVLAADAVVLPYRSIWSSGVMERAALYSTPVIATRVGGLAQQALDRDGITIVEDDAGLARAMARSLGAVTVGEPVTDWVIPAGTDRAAIQAQIGERAAARRGGRPVVGSGSVPTRPAPSRASAPLRRVPPLALPPTTSISPVAALLKKLVRRLTAWQMDPMVHHVNRLRQASIQAIEESAAADGRRDP